MVATVHKCDSLRCPNCISSPPDAPTEWAAGSELLHQCHLTQWVSTVYPSEKDLFWLGFSRISSCENRQAHLQTKTRRWEGIQSWERNELHGDKITCPFAVLFFTELASRLSLIFNIIVCKHPTILRYTYTPVPAELLQSVNNAWLTYDLTYYISFPCICFSELLCGLCGQEPEAIQRQCYCE